MTAPPRLPTAADRRRRRRVAIAVVVVGAVTSTLLALVTIRAMTKPGAQNALGDDTFRVGEAALLARRVAADDYPLLFQDLRSGSFDLFVDHDRRRAPSVGWRAFEAHAPGAPRHCQLRYEGGRGFVDPCTSVRYPLEGTGLRSFRVVVEKGVVVVDLRTADPG